MVWDVTILLDILVIYELDQQDFGDDSGVMRVSDTLKWRTYM